MLRRFTSGAAAASLLFLAACSDSPAPSSGPDPTPATTSPARHDAGAPLAVADASADGASSVSTDAGPAESADAGLHCTGVPDPCSLRGSFCSESIGCVSSSACTGVSSSCYSQFSSFACGALEGCYWSTTSSSCSGSSWGCDLFSGSSSCISQSGCRWESECSGTPRACALIPVEQCGLQAGCMLAF